MNEPSIIHPDHAFDLYLNGLITPEELYQYERVFMAWYRTTPNGRNF